MEKNRIQYLTTLHLGIIQIGENTLSQIAHYSCIIGSAFQIIVSILILSIYQTQAFGVPIHLLERFPENNLIYIIIIVLCLFIKVCLIIGTLFFSKISNMMVKQGILFLISVCDQILFLVDSLMLGIMLDESQILIFLAAINLFFGFILRLLNEVISFNYSFIYLYQYKKMPTFFTTLLTSILTSLFLVFQLKMNNDIYMILFFVIAVLKVIIELRFFYQIPYMNGNILSLKQAVFNNWLCFMIAEGGSLLFEIVSENTVVFFIILYGFGIWLNLTCMNYVKEKRLVVDIETAQNWEDINTKIQFSYELIFYDKLDKMSTISKQHFQKCKIPTCKCRWSELVSPIDFRTKVFANKSDVFQLKVFLKYYLLVLCQNFKERFIEVTQPWVVYISALSLLNLYPKLLYYSVNFQSLFSNEISFNQKFIVNFLKRQILQFIEQKNNKDSVLQIERIKKVEELQNNLSENIKKISQIKSKIWLALLQSPVEQHIIEKLFQSEIDQRNEILKTYKQIIKIPHKKLGLWRMMTNYCKNIIEDHNLERVVRKNVSKQDLIIKNSEGMDTKQGSHPRKIQQFLNFQQNYCLLKIGTSQKKLGYIQWHNDNIYNMLGFSKNKRLVGESIDILIPQIFRQYHHDVLKQWYQYPKTQKLNKLTQTYIRTHIREFQSVLLYIKILTMQDDCGVFAIISQSTRQRFLILDSDLNDVSANNFIKDKLRSKIHHPSILLPLLSKDYLKLKEFKGKKFQEHLLRFSLIPNYHEYYEQYQMEIKNIDPGLSKQDYHQEKQNVIEKIASMIARAQSTQFLQIDILTKPITITHKNNAITYILVKQSIDQDSFNDQNQKLKKRKQNNNSTTFQVQSSNNFHVNNTKTKQKKDLDFQQSQSSISSSKNITNRQFISKLKNSELLELEKALYICLFIYFICEIVRLVEVYYFSDTLKQILSADISVNTFVQYAETIYDNAMINSYTFANNVTGLLADKSQAFLDLVDFNYDSLIEGLKIHSNQVDNIWIKQFSSQFVPWISGNGVQHAFPVTVWFQTWGKISSLASKNTTSSASYLKLLNTNYQFLRQASHKYAKYYISKAQLFTNMLKYINLSLLPINLITIIAILYFFNKYLNQKQKIRYDFVKIFTQIDQVSIKNYASHYNQYDQQLHQSEQIQEEKQTGYLNRKVAINKSKPTSLYRLYMFLIGLIIVFDLVTSISSYLKSNSLFSAYQLSSNIKQSFHYQIQSLIQIKQMSLGLHSYQQQLSLYALNQDDFEQFKDNAIKIFNQFVSQLNNTQNHMLQLLIGNVCDILEPILPSTLNDICTNSYSLQIIKAGTMTFSHYVVDVMLEQTQNFINKAGSEAQKSKQYPEIMSNVSLVDGSISLTFRLIVVEKIQQEISKIIESYRIVLINETVGMATATVVTLVVFIILTYFFKKKQNKDWEYIYGSLLIVPEKELLKASTVSKLVMQLKDKSLK